MRGKMKKKTALILGSTQKIPFKKCNASAYIQQNKILSSWQQIDTPPSEAISPLLRYNIYLRYNNYICNSCCMSGGQVLLYAQI